jgi:hypothetical protein
MTLEATVDNFKIDPLAGNAAAITLRVKVKPDPDDVAVLYQLQDSDVQLTITPPNAHATPKTRPDLADQAEQA